MFLIIVGTRPEAIKMFPLAKEMQDRDIPYKVLITGQQSNEMIDIFSAFGVPVDQLCEFSSTKTLNLAQKLARFVTELGSIFETSDVRGILVHGDTLSTLAAALTAFLSKCRLIHIEAGLRTWNLQSPWPEEGIRCMVGAIACVHMAPTEQAKRNLLSSQVPEENILVVGNTVIDAVRLTQTMPHLSVNFDRIIPPLERFVLVTCHRRENFGVGIEELCNALAILHANTDLHFIIPVHPNPKVSSHLRHRLSNLKRIYLIEPQNYFSFCDLLARCWVILTDSGGLQEEGPYFKKPVLVMRDDTERPEAIQSRVAKLIGCKEKSIVEEIMRLNTDATYYSTFTGPNPFGDGFASKRIVDYLVESVQ